MGHVYIPGLRVSEYELVKKHRILPIKGEVLAEVGQSVLPDTVVARAFIPGKVKAENIAGLLSIEPSEVKTYMKKKVGETFSKDDILAESKGFFGLFRTAIKAPFDGAVEGISNITGQVIFRAEPAPLEVKAYIPGIVKEVYPKEGVLIETWASFIQGIFGIGGERYGTIKIVVDDPTEPLDESKIDESCRGAIIVGGTVLPVSTIEKAEKFGVIGIVIGGIDARDLVDYLGYDLGVAITGSESTLLSIIVTEGFGDIPMANKTFELLRKYQGHRASINGATQIRAGVIRPEIIIQQKEPSNEILYKIISPEMKGLEMGSTVRVIRVPYFGKIGKVDELPAELRKLESETEARVAVIRFGDKVVTVPRANLEMIE